MKTESFAFQIKKEVIDNIKSPKHIKAFVKGFIFSNSIIEENNYKIVIKNDYLRTKFISFLDKTRTIYKYDVKQKSYIFISTGDYNLNNLTEYQAAFFSGVFCASGNISTKKTASYHLEIFSHYQENTEFLVDILNAHNFQFNIFERNNKVYAYIKKLEQICDFLGAIEAKTSYFELQDIKISRDIENSINRVQNIDISNISRVAKSNLKHSANIKFIFDNHLEKYFNENQLVFFKLKLENPYSTLNDLSDILYEKYNINMTKSGLNHWLIKLNTIAKMYGVK
ncbi:DNA-binding protein WhiA [Mycoplasmopsis alligatoris]|uniref:Probable cell division protein WhiA n=1 Tax=Mycoplasmopsis alligatoris A21JP2 TaxID=747682 RepID=D4XWY3_9BACT|nr:DNA-binding protein WhiA [Mycoplasmopsis alligatoris]EFF41306.1 conserved hypothetical protein [Mycoplasmopsis alligatoris A21JP2]